MRIVVRSFLIVFGLFLTFSLRADPGPMSISFTTPGVPGLDGPSNSDGVDKSWWTTACPVGNGKLAAMVFGGVGYELIQFNEDTIWTGQPHDYSNTNSTLTRLRTIQTNCFNGQSILTDAGAYLIATPSRLPEYQCPGALALTFPHNNQSNYLRSLNLSTATVNVHYHYGGVRYDRDIFASAPSNRVIVIHFTTTNDSPTITFTCTLTNHQTATYSTNGNDLVMHARVTTRGDDRYFTTPALGLTNAVQYDARVRMIATGGTVSGTSSSLSVANATEVTLYLSVVSNVKSYNELDYATNYVTTCSNNVANAAALGYDALRQAQQDDYTALFNRVVLDLGVNSTKTNYDMGYRKKLMASDPNDPNLVALFFQLGRYLMISGSRPGSQALTLQGKWNDMTNMFNLWGCKMTLNINEEMNYWGAEVANLSECTLPLFDLIQDLSVTGNKVALASYFCTNTDPTLTNAWVAHHNTDLWRNAAPVNGWDGYWPSGGAWLCQHLWWHYQYTGDTEWLRTNAYPLMKGAAEFFQGFLRTIPTDSIYYSTNNWMVTCPSMSPEHSDPASHSNYPSPTMDNDIIRELFKNVIAASGILNTDAEFRASISNLLTRLPPDRINSAGGLSEFLGYDDGAYDTGHRHCSGLVGFFPGEEISPFYTPVLAQAAKVTVDVKGDPTTDTPWSRAWRINLHTRGQDDARAFLALTNILGGSKVSTNLMFGDGSEGSKRQVDFIFSSLSGIAEMFLQSQSGEVFLLPALPRAFTNGSVSGLCARGGFEVDNMTWTNGRLTGATILSKLGNTCRLRPKMPVNVMLGTNYVPAPMVLPGLYQFSTIAGSNYTIVPANVAETENLTATFSAGDGHQITTNAVFSNSRGTLLTANAANDYVTYTVSNLTAGTYDIYIGADAGANRGKFQLACGPAGGTLSNIGLVQDTYSATNVVYLVPNPLVANTSPNYITLWTNMLKEFVCTNWQAPLNGNYQFKFTVQGSSNYNLAFDYIKLTPAQTVAPANAAPATPVNASPANGAANQSPGLALQASVFSDPDSGDTHAASEWLVWRGSTNVFDSGTDSVNKTNLVVPAGKLDYGTTYNWQVRYQDNHSVWGGYSTQTMFSTVVPTLGALGTLGLNGKLVFAWPTNTAGFSLECVTNLTSTNWVPATPPPVVVGGAYVVTNTLTAEKMFYRLHKP